MSIEIKVCRDRFFFRAICNIFQDILIVFKSSYGLPTAVDILGFRVTSLLNPNSKIARIVHVREFNR